MSLDKTKNNNKMKTNHIFVNLNEKYFLLQTGERFPAFCSKEK